MKHTLLILLLCIFSTPLFGFLNPVRDNVVKGNKMLSDGNYEKALEYFNRALTEDPTNHMVRYNMGNAYYKKELYKKAITNYEKSLYGTSPKYQASIYHNLGNCYYKLEDYQSAVDQYINSLKNNDTDKQTKYNLELARKKLREQADKNKNQQKTESQDKKSNKKDSQKNDKKNDQKNKQQKKKDQQKKNQSKNKSQKGQDKSKQVKVKKISKENAEQLLKALADKQKNKTNYIKYQQVVPGGKVDKEW